ncbi:hypothetical protein N7539_009392 [Penicillium diatomitis]|uniref:Uncharacterized protein n=1 Tax=Penicillium diatomitis TaxID=2819901 RepID=A0A9X0BJ44_9EURO|nr:uncharacterized protein N7539_009392 [Penicillium diatomitis]KAJ5466663.1 hypothetical protein N7539_009392 [Penicillium diatomitis]
MGLLVFWNLSFVHYYDSDSDSDSDYDYDYDFCHYDYYCPLLILAICLHQPACHGRNFSECSSLGGAGLAIARIMGFFPSDIPRCIQQEMSAINLVCRPCAFPVIDRISLV